MTAKDDEYIRILALREKFRDEYAARRDPIVSDRMLWRAQAFRHIVHLMPGQTILLLGAGEGHITQQVIAVTHCENPITAVTFRSQPIVERSSSDSLELISAVSLPGPLSARRFDLILAIDLFDRRNGRWLLRKMYDLLNEGGEFVAYDSNPRNLVLMIRHVVSHVFGIRDARLLLSRTELREMITDVGFERTLTVYNDFVYAPLSRKLIWFLRNLSIVLENMPIVQSLAGSIFTHAQRPPVSVRPTNQSLCRHESLRRSVSVVIPCHNEEMNIESLVHSLVALYGDYLCEIVLVDDNSADGTRDVIQRLHEKYPLITPIYRSPPNGVGLALADGYRVASGRFVLSMDCDFQHLLPEFRDLFDAAAEGGKFIVGSRFSRHSVLLNYPFTKIVANRGFHLLAQAVLWRRFRDLTNNLKLMHRDILERLELHEAGFAANAETGLQPLLVGTEVTEVPISWINRTADMGASSFRLVHVGGGYWRVLWHIWLGRMFCAGRYKSLFSNRRSSDAN